VSPAEGGRARTAPDVRVAYVMSRFPKLTETFIFNEILAVEQHGARVDIYPLQRDPTGLAQPGAATLAARARYLPHLSRAILGSQLHFLRRRPRAYLGALGTALRGTWGSRRFFAAAVLYFPKIVHTARLAAQDGVDHVHAHFATHPALAALVIGRLTGIPFSFTAHGSDIHIDRRMLCRKVAEAAFVVPISSANAEVIETECPGASSRMEVIHCGVDVSRFRPRDDPAEAPARPAGRAFTVLTIGTLHEVKGQRFLIEAAAVLRDAGLDICVEFIGDGPDAADLRHLASARGLSGRVDFLGRRTQDEVLERLWLADAVVAPSVPSRLGQREGIPIVLMEAMACGLPVVASRLSGIPELVRHERSGLLVTPGDPVELAGAIRRLVEDPDLRARLGQGGRAQVEAEFDLDKNARRLVDRFAESQA
jgi:glycosyltransferase involved in cell wall biosynthesis